MTPPYSRILVLEDWIRVKEIMMYYNRTSGWLEFVGEKIMFFDSKPSFGGWRVTLEQVLKRIEDENT